MIQVSAQVSPSSSCVFVISCHDASDSIRVAAASVVYGLQALYNGNRTGGVLGKWPFPPYYWWESGAAWGGMVNYWHFTGDNSYVNVTYEALVSQIGPTNDFILPQEKSNTVIRLYTIENSTSMTDLL